MKKNDNFYQCLVRKNQKILLRKINVGEAKKNKTKKVLGTPPKFS